MTTPPSPLPVAVSTASEISVKFAIPVDIISGLPVAAAWRMSVGSTHSKDAILYAGGSNCSRKSTAVISNGELNTVIPNSRPLSKSAACQSQGVWAS